MKSCLSHIPVHALLAALLLTAPAAGAGEPPRKKPPTASEAGHDRKKDDRRKRDESARLHELEKQLDSARRELEQARDSLHEAQKELAAKSEAISSLEAKLSSVFKQLEQAQAEAKKAGGGDRAKLARELEEEKKKVAALQDELKDVQRRAAEAIAKAKAETEAARSGAVAAAPAKKSEPDRKKEEPKAAPRAPQIAPILYAKCSAVNYPERKRALDQVRAVLKQHPKAKIVISGFADDSRYAQTNQDVSENRAHYLAAYLRVNGVAKDRIEARGLGNSRPVKGQPNRRVEFEVRP